MDHTHGRKRYRKKQRERELMARIFQYEDSSITTIVSLGHVW